LAELAWTPSQLRNYPDFLIRLRTQKKLLDQMKVNAADNFDEINFSSSTVSSKDIDVSLQSSLPGASVYYTINGISPSLKDEVYKDAISITKSCVLKAQLYNTHRQKTGRVFQQKFTVHKAVGKPVTLINKPIGRFNTDPEALVNGTGGTDRYNNGQWVGFSGDNLEAVIDLRTEEKISSVSMNFLNYHWQRMWAPVLVEIFISTDSVKFTKIYTAGNFPVNGINSLHALVKPVKTRYIKVTGLNKGIIPAGEYGSGNKALLMIDEILIN
jgi:hexosaminidase